MSDKPAGDGPPPAGPIGTGEAGDAPRSGPPVDEPLPPDPATARPTGRPGTDPYRRRIRSLLVGTAVAVVLALLLFVVLKPAARTGSGQPAVVGIGSAAPEVRLPNLLSTPAQPLPAVDLARLGKDRHRPVILNFYASWCTPCQQETPLFGATAAAQAAKGSPVQFVGVDVADTSNGGATAVAFTHRSGVSYPVGVDRTFGAAGAYGLFGLPDTVFINEEGVVVGRHLGAIDAAQLQSWLHRLAGAAG